jgi:hypothetical protein
MLQLKNESPFAPAISLLPNKNGIDTLFVVIKATFELWPVLKLAEKQVPPVLADEYWGEPGISSLKYASELHTGKPSTDVLLVGQAWPPDGKRATEMLVSLQVAERRKIIRVFGDRVWKSGGSFTSPQPFESMPLVFERAYGGTQVLDETRILAEERNPVGKGFAGKRSASDMAHEALPNLEDPAHVLSRAGVRSEPACFSFVATHWLPRRAFAGTYDEAWQKKRAPYLPLDFDSRFFNCACLEMTFDRFLRGDETVAIQGASQRGPVQLTIPRCSLRTAVKIAGRSETPPPNLETVLLEPDANRMCMTWRAQVPCDKQALKVEEITVTVDAIELDARGRR